MIEFSGLGDSCEILQNSANFPDQGHGNVALTAKELEKLRSSQPGQVIFTRGDVFFWRIVVESLPRYAIWLDPMVQMRREYGQDVDRKG